MAADPFGAPLAPDERVALLNRLALLRGTLAEEDLNVYVVDQYIKVLQRS